MMIFKIQPIQLKLIVSSYSQRHQWRNQSCKPILSHPILLALERKRSVNLRHLKSKSQGLINWEKLTKKVRLWKRSWMTLIEWLMRSLTKRTLQSYHKSLMRRRESNLLPRFSDFLNITMFLPSREELVFLNCSRELISLRKLRCSLYGRLKIKGKSLFNYNLLVGFKILWRSANQSLHRSCYESTSINWNNLKNTWL